MKRLALILVLAPMCAHAALHDCTEPEPVTHRIARVVHNLTHRHKLPPRPMFCGEPDMVTVTVEAPPSLDLGAAPTLAQADTDGPLGGSVSGPAPMVAAPWIYAPPPPLDGPRFISPHQPVPEPPAFYVLLAA